MNIRTLTSANGAIASATLTAFDVHCLIAALKATNLPRAAESSGIVVYSLGTRIDDITKQLEKWHVRQG